VVEGDSRNLLIRETPEDFSSTERSYGFTRLGTTCSSAGLIPGSSPHSGLTKGYLFDVLPSLQQQVNSGLWDYSISIGGGTNNLQYLHAGFDYELNDTFSVSSVGYYWGYVLLSGGTYYYDRWWIEWRYVFNDVFLETWEPGDVNLGDFVTAKRQYLISTPYSISWPATDPTPALLLPSKVVGLVYETPMQPYLSTSVKPHRFMSFVGLDETRGYVGGESFPYSLRNFDTAARNIEGDAVAVNFFSTKNAIENGLSALEANHLENLLGLKEVLSLLEPGIMLLDLIKGKNKFDIPNLLDLLSNTTLVLKFGILPSISDAKELKTKITNLRRTFTRNLGGSFYGVAQIDVPEEISNNFPGMKITAHSKVILSINNDSYLPYFLHLDQLGLLPTLSRTWDLIPLSFVVDWFLKVGNQLDVVDAYARMMLVDIEYCVHSISIDWTPTDALQQEYGFDHVSEGSKGLYRYYYRYTSPVAPVLTPSRLNLFGFGSLPDWQVVSSLLWNWK
jgi:hypothetical protein